MNTETTTLKESDFILRRLLEPMDGYALGFPVALLLIAGIFFLAIRHRDELKQLFERVHWLIKLPVLIVLAFLMNVVLRRVVALEVVQVLGIVVAIFLAVAVMLGCGLVIVILRKHKGESVFLGLAILAVVVGGAAYVVFGRMLLEIPMAWLIVIVPVMAVAAFYTGAMYFYDARTVHWGWASFLGLLRITAYSLLCVCFLMPGCQEYNTTITKSKVLLLFDVSGSMAAVDGQEGDGGTTRQEKIIDFLTTHFGQGGASNKTFLEHLTDNTLVACYRFGAVADDEPVLFDGDQAKAWTGKDQWRTWFSPDKIEKEEIVKKMPAHIAGEAQQAAYVQSKLALYSQLKNGTDVGGSTLQVLQREGNSRIQAVVVFTDGNSNRGDDEAIRQLLERAGNVKRPVHVITVGVGDYKQPVRIRINPLIAPQAVRADDGVFEVRVPVFGDGLPGVDFDVTLKVQRVKDRNGIELKKDQVYTVKKEKGTFGGGGGEFPYKEVEFKVNLEQLTGIKATEDAKGQLQGQWNFTAEIPRHPREAPDKDNPIHISHPRPVMVNDSTLRVLLFASGPTRDYQFVRTLMAREVDAKRAKMSIYLQSSKGLEDVSQDVDGNHLLNDFPNKLERPKEGKKGDAAREGDPMNLKSYDVIIAFDPDWKQLSKNQKDILKEWVEGDSGGGIIFVAGPQHTLPLIPPVAEDKFKIWDLKQIYALFPVVLRRPPPGVQADQMHDATIPYMLDFTGIAKGFDFIKLDDDNPLPLGGWKEFFGKAVRSEFPGGIPKDHSERGFFNYFLIDKAKDGAEVIATFSDFKAQKTSDGKPQPYFVSLRVGKGKSFYIGSGEMWRLRTFKEEYHQRFWVKLARYVSSGGGAKSFGRFVMAGEYVTGIIPIEAEVRDKDGFPLAQDGSPLVTVRRVDGRDSKDDKLPTLQLKAKKLPGKWSGTFGGNLRLDKEGFYEVRIDIQGTDESITQTFEVKPPNVEMSDLRTNFPKLYNMATDATPAMLSRVDAIVRQRLEGGHDRPLGGPENRVDTGTGARLFFRLAGAEPITQCIAKVRPEEDKVKGAVRDLWDRGPEVFNAASWEKVPALVWTMYGLPAAVMVLVAVMMLIGGRWITALGVMLTLALVEGGVAWVIANTVPNVLFQPSAYGVLFVVPTLICLTAAGILLVAQRYYWVAAVVAGLVLYLAVLLIVDWTMVDLEWVPMKVDFTWMLLLIGFILSAEWFTRKMLRLA